MYFQLNMFNFIFKEFFTLIGIFLVFDVLRFYYKYFTRPNPLPGPIPLPYIGNAHQILYTVFKAGIYQFDLGQYARLQAEKYGGISEVYQGNERVIYLSRAEYLEKTYSPNINTNFFPRIVLNGVSELNVNGLIFNNDYKSWKRIRKFVTQSLMSPKFLRGFTITAQKLFEETETRWMDHDEEITINLSEWIKCFTTDITISTSTGQKSHCLASNNLKSSEWTDDMKESREIYDAVELFFKSLAFFSSFPYFLRAYFPIFSYYQNYFLNNLNFLRNEILDRVKKRRDQIERMSEDEKVGVDLLDILLTANTPRDPHGWKNDDTEKPLTDVEIREIIVDLTIAGSDTSSNLFTVVFWHINTHPEVKARFLEEIKSIFGKDITDRKIAYEDLEKFKYLDAIVREASRIQPVVPLNGREVTTSETIAGYKWEADTKFYINNIFIQLQKDYWKEPEKFMPERFLNEENGVIKNSFIPFGGGTRPCPGKLLSLTEIKTLLILFFGKYNVDLVDKVNPLKHVYAGVVLYPNVMIKLSPKHKRKL